MPCDGRVGDGLTPIPFFVSPRTNLIGRIRRNGLSLRQLMDLVARPSEVSGLFSLSASTVLGALWLQTHFPPSDWETLLSDQATFGSDCLSSLLEDARLAGLAVQKFAVVGS